MATAGKVEAVEVYTVNEPCGAKTLEYKVLGIKSSISNKINPDICVPQGLVMCSKVKTRNLLSDFKSAFKSLKGGELTELSKLTQDVRCGTPSSSNMNNLFFLSFLFVKNLETSCCTS